MCHENEKRALVKQGSSSPVRVIERTREYEVIQSGEYTFKFLNQPTKEEAMSENQKAEDGNQAEEFDILSLDLDERKKEEVEEPDTQPNDSLPVDHMSSDELVINLARIHPDKFPFIAAMLRHGPELLPDGDSTPGIIEGLVFQFIVKSARSADEPKAAMVVAMIRNIWKEAVGS